jgi:radical SAM superfamily enzyme YgiQ (UPF0313 family)
MLIGAESGYQPALDLMNKGLRVEETIELAEKCRDKKIKLSTSVLWGLPWDPDYEKTRRLIDTEVRYTIDLLDKVFSINPRNKLLFAIYTPYPGSPLYSRSLGLGLEPPQTLDGWANWVLQERNTPWVTHQQEGRVKMLHPYIFPFIDPDSYPLAMGMFHNRFVKLIAKVPYKIFRLIARLRWKFKFFALPIDYYLFKLYLWMASKLRLPSA